MPAVGSVAEEQSAYPLELLRCRNCTLVQIGLEVSPEVLFPYSYPYLTGSTRILKENFTELAKEAIPFLGLEAGDLVIDIGSNDGTLLQNFRKKNLQVLGIEPSRAGEVARKHGIETLTEYFGKNLSESVRQSHGVARLVTAANVFAHIGDIHGVVEGIVNILSPDGVFISESHYFVDLVETVQYDTIYHEHLRYYTVGSLKTLLEMHGLEIIHVKRIPTHGGSIRVYAGRKGGRKVQKSVVEQLAEEERTGISDGSVLIEFRRNVIKSKLELHKLIAPLRESGARIYGIGAPSRASTLINYVGLDDGILDCVMEISTSHKLGKYIPGTRIPVMDESKLFQDQPEYALMLSWHIADEVAVNLKKKGYVGKFIVPLPEPRVMLFD